MYKYSYSATLQEIAENDYNLNIPRYVDIFLIKEAPIDLDQVQQDLKNIHKEIAEIEQEINAYLKELGCRKMSNTQKKNVPELRFPEFEGEWEREAVCSFY